MTLPAKPILELLQARDYSDPNFLPCVTALVLCEYEAQYSKRTSAGHLQTLQAWDDEFGKDFLALVSWMFGEENETISQNRLVDAVKKCRFYNESHEGREQIIASALIDLLDEKQLCHDFGDRFVHASHVELLFLKAAAGELTGVDPTWRAWQNVPSPTDTRNVGEKFTAACPTLSSGALTRYQRRTAAGLAELEQHSQDKNVIAMRFQIYDVCEEAAAALVAQASALTEAQLDAEVKKLTELALQRVQQRANVQDRGVRTGSRSRAFRQLLPRI